MTLSLGCPTTVFHPFLCNFCMVLGFPYPLASIASALQQKGADSGEIWDFCALMPVAGFADSALMKYDSFLVDRRLLMAKKIRQWIDVL